jgi:hypothetical protein
MSEMSAKSDPELYAIIDNSPDANVRGAARVELELRTFRRWRIVADRHARIAWLAVVAACASALAAIAAAIAAWTNH